MTLEEVKHAFELWRANRIKRGPIPDALWLMVQTLLPHYNKSQITEALKMNVAQLELGCQKIRTPEKTLEGGFAIRYFSHEESSMIPHSAVKFIIKLIG